MITVQEIPSLPIDYENRMHKECQLTPYLILALGENYFEQFAEQPFTLPSQVRHDNQLLAR